MNHSTVSGCGEIEHSENSRKSGQQKQTVKKLHSCPIACVGATIGRPSTYRSNAFSGIVSCKANGRRRAMLAPKEFFDSLKKSNRPEAVGHLYKTHFENRSSSLPILCDTTKKKAAAISLPQLFGGSWWIRTTEALSSRFTVCPHWPLGKAPIFCFASAVSPGDVCYYSKGVSKLQAFF